MRKAILNHKQCVACGSCPSVCPRDAIKIDRGMYAKIDMDKCVGCGLCQKTCPASVIEIEVTK